MDEATEPHDRVKAALFVDFDNIYSGLRKIHPKAAEEFATNPARWLEWFEQGMPSREADGATPRRRDLLLRHCYLNPRVYAAYRADFTRSAFRVVDCPSLTQSKNSTDIHMVMDILDALSHRTRFDEFIILSGDSDFTPVLLRLRLHDRRTVILTPGPAAQAYKAASDHVISEDVFIEEGLGLRPESARQAPAARQPAAAAATAPTPPVAPSGKSNALKDKIIARLNKLVAASASPIDMASASTDVIKHVGAEVLTTKWAGAGSFKRLLSGVTAKDSGIKIASHGPGYLYDPARHTLPPPATPKPPPAAPKPSPSVPKPPPALPKPSPALPDAQDGWEGHPEKLSAFALRVSRLTGAPPLKPEEYALVFKALEDELKEESYLLASTSRAVRDRCNLRGRHVARHNISYILKGIAYGGHDFDGNASANNAEALGQMFREQVLKLCKSAQFDLSGEEQKLLERWIKA